MSFRHEKQEEPHPQALGPKQIRTGLMKSRQRSSLKLNRRLPDCHSLCVPPVIDHLGVDLSFTAVIPVKCRAIHQPTPVAGGQVHHAAPSAATLLTTPKPRGLAQQEQSLLWEGEGARPPWETSPCTAGISEGVCSDKMCGGR